MHVVLQVGLEAHERAVFAASSHHCEASAPTTSHCLVTPSRSPGEVVDLGAPVVLGPGPVQHCALLFFCGATQVKSWRVPAEFIAPN